MERGEFITGDFSIIEEGMLDELGRELTMDELKRAMWGMGSYKAVAQRVSGDLLQSNMELDRTDTIFLCQGHS